MGRKKIGTETVNQQHTEQIQPRDGFCLVYFLLSGCQLFSELAEREWGTYQVEVNFLYKVSPFSSLKRSVAYRVNINI